MTPDDTELYEFNTHAFVVKIWLEEGLRWRGRTVPTAAERNGDFSGSLLNNVVRTIYNPFTSTVDPTTGRPQKREYGAWMMGGFRLLAKLKGLRGTAFDVFGYGEDRKLERRLIAEYEARVAEILECLDPATHAAAVELASLPEHIRGFGPVKSEHLKKIQGFNARPDNPTPSAKVALRLMRRNSSPSCKDGSDRSVPITRRQPMPTDRLRGLSHRTSGKQYLERLWPTITAGRIISPLSRGQACPVKPLGGLVKRLQGVTLIFPGHGIPPPTVHRHLPLL